MIKRRKKIITHLLITLFVAASFFGCTLAIKESLVMHDHSSTSAMACCDSQGLFSTTDHNMPIILGGYVNLQLLLFLISVYLFVKSNNKLRDNIIKNYIKARDRYGSFRIFYYFTNLFRRGILHPKIY